jgi:hypothetical protein
MANLVALRLLAVLIACSVAVFATASSPVEINTPSNEIPSQSSFQRHYKVTAYITLLAIPIFSRSAVGFGFAGADELSGGNRQLLTLRFLSGSTPERAHGLNRFGFIQENVEQRNRTTISADYFGLMTASPEETLNDAKAALNSKTGPPVAFVATRAVISRQKTSYSVHHLLLPSSYRGSNVDQLLRQVQAEFAVPLPGQSEKTEPLDAAAGAFLSSLRQAILSPVSVYQSRIVFNGNTFQFHASKRPDAKTAAELQRAGLTESTGSIVQLSGVLRNEKSNDSSAFRLWFEQGSANFLPLRFEFKPKSYLRLVFDEEPAATAQTLTLNREWPQ